MRRWGVMIRMLTLTLQCISSRRWDVIWTRQGQGLPSTIATICQLSNPRNRSYDARNVLSQVQSKRPAIAPPALPDEALFPGASNVKYNTLLRHYQAPWSTRMKRTNRPRCSSRPSCTCHEGSYPQPRISWTSSSSVAIATLTCTT